MGLGFCWVYVGWVIVLMLARITLWVVEAVWVSLSGHRMVVGWWVGFRCLGLFPDFDG